MKQINVYKFIEETVGTIEHFAEQGAWPVKITAQTPEILKVTSGLAIVDGRLAKVGPVRMKAKFAAAYYKFKYLEQKKIAEELLDAIYDVKESLREYI